MDGYDFLNFVTWLQDANRKPAMYAFTAGEARDAASAVEQSGVLARLAVPGKVEEYVTNLLRSERERTFHGSSANERCFMAALELVRNEFIKLSALVDKSLQPESEVPR